MVFLIVVTALFLYIGYTDWRDHEIRPGDWIDPRWLV
jgi:hypothetical protein